MWIFWALPRVGITALSLSMCLLSSVPLAVYAEAAVSMSAPVLRFSELNITGDEFVVIQNAGSAPAHLSDYWLGYTSSDTGMAVPTQQLADQILPSGAALVLNKGAVATCGATQLEALSVSLSNTAGTVALWRLVGSRAQASFELSTSVSWGKLATSPNYLHVADEANVAKQNLPNATWYKQLAQSSVEQPWQVGSLSDCAFTPVTTATTKTENQTIVWQTSGESPPYTVTATSVVTGNETGGAIPAADVGLKGLQLSELLPNPASPSTDAEDEFIELYNPNDTVFDLSGFQLQTVSSTSTIVHSYTFPPGTLVNAKSFKAFFTPDTHLSISNSGGRAWLVDPLGNIVTQSDAYGTAKEGEAWIRAGDNWRWTSVPTPNAANVLTAPTGSAVTKSATVNGIKVTDVKGANTTATKSKVTTTPKPTKSSKATKATSLPATTSQSVAQVTPVHPLTLVAVVAGALLYGAYEYRADMANRLYQYRKYRAARRIARG